MSEIAPYQHANVVQDPFRWQLLVRHRTTRSTLGPFPVARPGVPITHPGLRFVCVQRALVANCRLADPVSLRFALCGRSLTRMARRGCEPIRASAINLRTGSLTPLDARPIPY